MSRSWTADQLAAVEALLDEGHSYRRISASLGLRCETIRKFGNRRKDEKPGMAPEFDSEILEAAHAGGVTDPRNLSHFWKITKDEQGNGYSLFVKNPATGQSVCLTDMVRETILGTPPATLDLEPREPHSGEHLLVVDLADVHFLKLCVKTETGFTYDRTVAHHRVVEGTKALLRMARPWGVGRILFVTGNDILHVDGPRTSTTSGTYQDSEGTIFQGFTDAGLALEEAIHAASGLADVDLIHCMSNHDWVMGWALTQAVAARATRNPRVRATPYNISERHRKYYRYERNLFGVTHGDGAKEEKLYGLMVTEARQHISECQNLYWLLHHVHHKIRKTRGEFEMLREKDHNGMTAHMRGTPNFEGHNVHIEYVRSPSAPDGWHDRNGYVNRQAVECFIYHPTIGQRARFTEWF